MKRQSDAGLILTLGAGVAMSGAVYFYDREPGAAEFLACLSTFCLVLALVRALWLMWREA